MSLMERVSGIWGGIKVGAMLPVAVPVAFMSSAGSGPGPALAVFFAGVVVVISGIALVGAVPLAAWFSVFGIPWYATVPVAYFSAWGLVGFCWKIKP